jgi:8-oxo-dGTP pyrophosphatase MutT (NUDIX family)
VGPASFIASNVLEPLAFPSSVRNPVSVKLVLVAACALVDADGRVLIAQRPAGRPMAGLWEFPGGKVEAGERPEDTLMRELREELGIVVDEACLSSRIKVSSGRSPSPATAIRISIF